MLNTYVPIIVLLVVALGMAGVFAVLAGLLGPKRPSKEKALPYECGVDPIGTPQIRFSVQFYRVALLFLVFDIEAAFLYPWAVMFRDLSCKGDVVNGICQGQTTAAGLLVMAVFAAILLLALAYVWRKGALQWD